MAMRRKWMFIVPAALLGMTLFVLLGGELVKLLWNWLLPPLFGWKEVTFWQALGLLALCRILFGGLRLGGGHRRGRWEHMTPEERDRLRQRLRERWGFGQPAGQDGGAV